MEDSAPISWKAPAKDASLWLGNTAQKFVFEELQQLEPLVLEADNPHISHVWRLLQTSNHFQAYSLLGGDTDVFEPFIRHHTAVTYLKDVILQ